jgi:hypothetical protein
VLTAICWFWSVIRIIYRLSLAEEILVLKGAHLFKKLKEL